MKLSRAVIVFTSLTILMMMITPESSHLVMAAISINDPPLPSVCAADDMIVSQSLCYNLGHDDGLANPGTNCPSGHNDSFCAGWADGVNSGGSSSSTTQGGGNNNGVTQQEQQQQNNLYQGDFNNLMPHGPWYHGP
jgi:hypothetical protein